MNKTTINNEWDFIINEINSSNKGCTEKGSMLFEFQILLSVLSKTKNSIEKLMLASIYQKMKEKYEK